MGKSALRQHSHWLWIAGLALIPLLIAGGFSDYMSRQSDTRYAEAYFGPQYQDVYGTPGGVARDWEQALKTGDPTLVVELTGLKDPPRIQPNPNMTLTILLEIDDAGYYHYLYYDLQTYDRLTQYVKDVRGRYVVAPIDFYFYWDSGQWQGVFTPLAIVWWLVLVVAGVAISLFQVGARARETMYGT